MIIPETVFDFGEADEGSVVTHEFTVRNTGKSPLQIHKVSPDCGCTLASFDPAVLPGGEGKVILNLNLTGYKGNVQKVTTVYSNDPASPRGSLIMRGKVRTLIEVSPASHISFRGMAQQQSEQVIELKGLAQPFRVTGTESNLEGSVSYRLETVEEGRHYRLRVTNLVERGEYIGHVKLLTDLPAKGEILVRVTGVLEGRIGVTPKTVLIGRPSFQQPLRTAKVKVVSHLNEPIRIARLVHDMKTMQVGQQPLPGQNGFLLELKPLMENLPQGTKEETVLSIETEPPADERLEVKVILIHAGTSSP
ncbi:MAG: DUF1573 domain-containing protein [Deltaproteobacteria bacterium]|nr:DUF1573 domain-containing protein [Deltaproteobacteria bacterium]